MLSRKSERTLAKILLSDFSDNMLLNSDGLQLTRTIRIAIKFLYISALLYIYVKLIMGGKFLQCFTYQRDTADICFQPHQNVGQKHHNKFCCCKITKFIKMTLPFTCSHSNIQQDPKIYSDAETRGHVLIDKTKPCSFYTRCLILRTLCVIFHKVAYLLWFVVNFRAYACTKFSGLNVQWCNKK